MYELKIKWNIFSNYCLIILLEYQAIGLMSRVFTNGPGDRGSIPGRVMPKTQKMLLMPPGLTLSTVR